VIEFGRAGKVTGTLLCRAWGASVPASLDYAPTRA